eukprot:COSAG03_NODE_28012_length_236_cov_21.408759_1_plen_27_part_01
MGGGGDLNSDLGPLTNWPPILVNFLSS